MNVQVEQLAGSFAFRLFTVYGLHTIADMRGLWAELEQLIDRCTSPFIVIGDFNVVNHANDKYNGNAVSEVETIDFTIFIVSSAMMEAPYGGIFYSWSNKGVGECRISSRIDKSFIKASMLDLFPDLMVKYLPGGMSDHTPLVVTLADEKQEGDKPVKFNNILAYD